MKKLPSKYRSWWSLMNDIQEQGHPILDLSRRVVIGDDEPVCIGEILPLAYGEVKSMVPPEHEVKRMIAYLELLEGMSGIEKEIDPKLRIFLNTILEVFYN